MRYTLCLQAGVGLYLGVGFYPTLRLGSDVGFLSRHTVPAVSNKIQTGRNSHIKFKLGGIPTRLPRIDLLPFSLFRLRFPLFRGRHNLKRPSLSPVKSMTDNGSFINNMHSNNNKINQLVSYHQRVPQAVLNRLFGIAYSAILQQN